MHLLKNNIPVGPFVEVETNTIETIEDIAKVTNVMLISLKFGFPIMLKSQLHAYDGKGNYAIKGKEDIAGAIELFSKF